MALSLKPYTPVRRPGVQCCASFPRVRSSVIASPLLSPKGYLRPLSSLLLANSRRADTSATMRVHASPNEEASNVVYNKEFGYSRKDIILIGVGLIALGYALYYGLQATGMDAGYAGNWVQLIVFVGICIGWVSTYVWRVATKQMTYVKQLEQYEDAVMRKRLDEMTEEEMTDLIKEADADRDRPGSDRR